MPPILKLFLYARMIGSKILLSKESVEKLGLELVKLGQNVDYFKLPKGNTLIDICVESVPKVADGKCSAFWNGRNLKSRFKGTSLYPQLFAFDLANCYGCPSDKNIVKINFYNTLVDLLQDGNDSAPVKFLNIAAKLSQQNELEPITMKDLSANLLRKLVS